MLEGLGERLSGWIGGHSKPVPTPAAPATVAEQLEASRAFWAKFDALANPRVLEDTTHLLTNVRAVLSHVMTRITPLDPWVSNKGSCFVKAEQLYKHLPPVTRNFFDIVTTHNRVQVQVGDVVVKNAAVHTFLATKPERSPEEVIIDMTWGQHIEESVRNHQTFCPFVGTRASLEALYANYTGDLIPSIHYHDKSNTKRAVFPAVLRTDAKLFAEIHYGYGRAQGSRIIEK